MPEVGDVAPEISLPDQTGKILTLTSLRGKTVVLYFYPKADTPGCTIESCSFRDNSATFAAADAVIVGISPDKPGAQKKFATKFDLPFTLFADADHTACEAYGVWVEKSMYGKKYMGVERSTFVIDPEGKITHIFRKVKIEGHSDEVLAAVTGSSE
jgi:peroxiredoxin Q/BCP